jgi:lysophospholipase L1-like esterase
MVALPLSLRLVRRGRPTPLLRRPTMLVRRCTLACLIVLLALVAVPAGEKAPAAKGFFIKDGDTVVMIGDSITEQHLYSNYVEMWTVSRFPAWKLTFRNVGIGGDTSPGGNGRFKRDVLAYKPTVLTVDFGMNDGGYRPFDEGRFANYMKGLHGIADQAKAAGIRVAWITPQPVEHNPNNAKAEAYNETLERFSDGVKEIAEKNGGIFVDQFHPYWAVIHKAREKGEKGRITGGDAVHPGPPGQSLMAASILKGLGFPPLVSRVEISSKQVGQAGVGTHNCEISELEGNQEGGVHTTLSFKRLDKALPFFPEDAKGILKWAPLLEEMNQYGLTVKGLKPGRYEIRLGGTKVAERSAAELAKGVNLASEVLTAGPVADQVRKVWKAVQDKNRYFHDQIFRGVVLNGKLQGEQREALYAERTKRMPELDAAVREALAMRPYPVEILPLAK